MSSFFPDHWSKQRVQEELVLAYSNKIYKKGNLYIGKMSDEIEVKMHIENKIIKTIFYEFTN